MRFSQYLISYENALREAVAIPQNKYALHKDQVIRYASNMTLTWMLEDLETVH